MNKWLPYVIAAVIGLGVAFLAFGPGMGASSSTEKVAVKAEKGGKKKVITAKNMGGDGFTVASPEDAPSTPEQRVEEALNNPPPPPGTLRPQNKAEIEHSARLERPFNKHFAYVASFWNRAAQLSGSADSDISRECSAMARLLRDQGALTDDEIDINGTIASEKALVAKVRSAAGGNAELEGVLAYIEASGQAVLDGKDPTTVPKPGK